MVQQWVLVLEPRWWATQWANCLVPLKGVALDAVLAVVLDEELVLGLAEELGKE
jgi:hypothetical protein